MPITVDTLERLLPAVYRVRDAEGGGELRALLGVLAESMAAAEEEVAQLYDDQFIETASGKAVARIGALVGARTFSLPTEKDETRPTRGAELVRAQVANAVRGRRARGTAAALEQAARDLTGWDAYVVEFFQRLATTQRMNHLRPENVAVASLRGAVALERINTPFETVTRTLDVRRIESGRGTHNIPNVGVFLWPFRGDRLASSPAVAVDERRFLVHPLGIDAALRTDPDPERDPAGLARPLNVPLPIGRRAMDAALSDYYGAGRSILVEADGAPVAADRIVVADLSNRGATDAAGWSCRPAAGKVAVDPVLGRIAFAAGSPAPAAGTVRVTAFVGHVTGIGGGAYERAASFVTPGLTLVRVPGDVAVLPPALGAVAAGGTVQVDDSGRYTAALAIAADAGARVELRGANEHRPVLDVSADLVIDGDGAEVFLNGLLIAGGAVVVRSGVARVHLRHCTLVPGRRLKRDGTPRSPSLPSLVVEGSGTTVELESCVVGALRVAAGSTVRARYSVIDATAPDLVAHTSPAPKTAGGALALEQCTVIGRVWTEALDASNSILLAQRTLPVDVWPAPVRSERRQEGCVRFSYLPLNSLAPRRYRCQPTAAAPDVAPVFRTLRYGQPDYVELTRDCPAEIAEGADDGGEMGALVRLRLRQREANLRAALPEQLRLGMAAGSFVSHA